MPKVALISLGCKVNQYESEAIAKNWLTLGLTLSLAFAMTPTFLF